MMKPCPFCGYAPTGEEELLDILDVDEFGEKVEKIKYVGVSCAGCYAYVPVQTHDKTEAIAAWNRRPTLSPAGVTEEQVEAAARATRSHTSDVLTMTEHMDLVRAALEAAAKVRPTLPAGHVAVPVERLTTVLDEYDAQTKALPIGHEDRTRGASSYNWRRSVVDDIRAMLSSLPNNQGEGK